MNIEEQLRQLSGRETKMHFNNAEVNPDTIRAIQINEIVPSCPENDLLFNKNETERNTKKVD